jgi:predicted adenine nucleotide alpha hydrolase (AANH) superfamily ATPase
MLFAKPPEPDGLISNNITDSIVADFFKNKEMLSEFRRILAMSDAISLLRLVSEDGDHVETANAFAATGKPRADDGERGARCLSCWQVRYFCRFRNMRVSASEICDF